ncbi:carboxy terminal-processing peptidase [Oceanospirillum sediminis]|uniref:Carboxy terminal-processing peptidase n=1 Tax=Oceanospirillum sediminis TaxID=2760088 RepID=A0A839IM10_9GAMM|nr:carboxy terminal-processing peptidase [Oceanospirillum sediminis]MBB1485539.1 carboxy terminal-processing peptidase [Oceanospirillum sediminis]
MLLRVIQTSLKPVQSAAIGLLLLFSASAYSDTSAQSPLAPSQAQKDAAQSVVDKLSYGHYNKVELNDDLSVEIFEHYLDQLDGSKAYFTQQDINSFAPFRKRLDDDLEAGNLEAAFTIYNRYQSKVLARLDNQLKALEAFPDDYQFNSDKRLRLDREDQPWAASEKELSELWAKRLENSMLSLKLSGKTIEEAKKTLKRRLENQRNRVSQARNEDVFQLYMNAYTQLYDPHTQYQSPRSSETFNIRMKLSLEGIGALLQSEDEYTKVVSLVPGGPADLAGELKPTDRIIGVGQDKEGEVVDVIGWRLDEVVDLIRGPKASTVRLQILPSDAKDNSKSKVISIVRNTVKLEDQAAKKSVIQLERDGQTQRIGVIDIPAFYVDFEAWRQGKEDFRSTTRDVARLIDELLQEGIDGLIIDLRNNGGGALQEANSLVGLFIERGATVQVRNAEERIDLLGDPDRSVAYSGPLAVLVNRLSASASEIFAGAIQDYQRGVVIGSQTFGKGTVQSVTPLEHGQLKLTRAKFYRISGESTQHKGVIPDITLPSLVDSKEVGESSLEFALPWDKVSPIRHRDYNQLNIWLPELRNRHDRRLNENPDLVYLQAQKTLLEKNRAIEFISLNEKVRQQETQALEDEQLALENQRRKAKNLEPLESLDDIEDTSDDPQNDAELVESSEIILDMIEVSQKNGSPAMAGSQQ